MKKTIKNFDQAVNAVISIKNHPDDYINVHHLDVINEVANMFSESYEHYCTLADALESHFA